MNNRLFTHRLDGYSLLIKFMLLFFIFLMLISNISTSVANDLSYNITPLDIGMSTTFDMENISIIDKNTTFQINLSSIDSIVILPDENIGLKTSIGKYIIKNPEDYPEINYTGSLEIKNITFVAFNNFKSSQKVEKLDKYEVKLTFDNIKEIDSLDNVNITTYEINWGDNSITTSVINTYSNKHTYKKSGTYPIKISVSDEFGYTYNLTHNFTVKYEGDLVHTYLIIEENKEEIAATSAGVSGMAILGFALTETGKYKLLSLLSLMMPMYTQIKKDDVLDQFVRGEIFGLIKTNPGIHYNEIMKKLDMKNGTLSYHLHMLEKMEMIKSRREGIRYRAFYPTGMKFPEKERYRLTDLQTEILEIIKVNEGIQQKDIAKKLNKKPQTINYNIKTLQQAELIKVKKKGRKTSCHIIKDNQNQLP